MSEFDPTDLADEEARNAQAQAEASELLRGEIGDLIWLMGIKRGRRVVWRLLSHSGVFRLSFDPGNPSVTAFNEGQRNLGLRLSALLMGNCPNDYAQMVQEHSNV